MNEPEIIFVPKDISMDEAIHAISVCRRLELLFGDGAYMLLPEEIKQQGLLVAEVRRNLKGEGA